MGRVKFRFYAACIFVAAVTNLSIFHKDLFEVRAKWNKETLCKDFKLNHIVVHVDLKGSPPKMEYLIALLRDFKAWGVTALLMEYEDMFPFDGDLQFLKAPNAYSRKELQNFLHMAMVNKIEIIPLIQTFGHMEYVLKYEIYSSLREDFTFSDSICPSKNASLTVIKKLLTQVISFHNSIKPLTTIHIGCDEVYRINMCSDCTKRNISTWELFLHHVKEVVRFVHKKYNVKALIWDDMMREIDPDTLHKSHLQDYVEPVVWAYKEDVLDDVKHKTWYVYSQVFKKMWIASAFKGADGDTNMIPNITKRYNNHLSWMKFATHYRTQTLQKPFKIQGIVLTGWSRYNHLRPLCEILPMGIPSLLLNLILIESYCKIEDKKLDQFVVSSWLSRSKCHRKINTKSTVLSVKDAENITHSCSFPHSELYEIFIRSFKMDNILLQHFTNDKLVFNDTRLGKDLLNSEKVEKKLINSLFKYYDLNTAVDIFQGRQSSLKKMLEKISKSKLQSIYHELLAQAISNKNET